MADVIMQYIYQLNNAARIKKQRHKHLAAKHHSIYPINLTETQPHIPTFRNKHINLP